MTAARPASGVSRILVLVLAIGTLLAACTAASPTPAAPTATPPSEASDPLQPSAEPSAPASEQPSAEPIPTDELGEFGCDMPVNGVGNVALAHLADVRFGQHDGFDRVVFEFSEGIPQFSLETAQPPFQQDASGLPLEVGGSAFWSLRLQGGTKQGEDGTATYDGPTEFEPGFDALVALVEGGDFEAQSTWYFGLESQSCVRVTTLPDPHRLVIDIEH